ncbi:MAG: hypothetical protein A3H70_01715 [Candidatus Komeilibacteria bacterium RIFCSPLOWO2_02_FULL_48_11]|uniref:Uncharacterized protein n=1 Tax=Candidatus Komeilibacteria bacterium RIFCSPLOWO2_02_FULL_48_11 TaxID=1798553 RepID=A0A1G2BRQ8_9BACT|nr:MAG: hypothetical protein A3H70_01715 [Candidatus Komeilibacteria bacterium RIFCSPLOWO2_02_FULL_48_11]
MFSFNGFGTTIYGRRDVNQADGSYVVTKWFIIIFFPIIPLGSYRVIKEKQKFFTIGFPKYQIVPVKFNTKQVVNTYITWWGIPVVLIILVLIFG